MTNFDSIEAIRAAKTSDLVAFWNENLHEEKAPIKKFADRKTAEARVIPLWESLNPGVVMDGASDAQPEVQAEVEAPTDLAPELSDEDQQTEEELAAELAAEEKKSAAAFRAMSHLTSQIDFATAPKENGKNGDKVKPGQEGRNASPMAAKTRASNAAGVSASWSDPEVLAARLTRNGTTVTVDGATSEHRSVREAFRHYRLPDSKHIRFRLALKASKKETFEHNDKKYVFTLLD